MQRDERCDVLFIIKRKYCVDREYEAHKVVLASCSSVFETMFFGSKRSVKRNADGLEVIQLEDVDQDAFGISLDIIYRSLTTTYSLGSDMAEEVAIIAEKYDIDCLRVQCDKVLCRIVNDSNGLQFASWAVNYHLPELKIKARSRALTEQGLAIIEAEAGLLDSNKIDPLRSLYVNPDTAAYLLTGGDLSLELSKSVVLAAISHAKQRVLKKRYNEYRQEELTTLLNPLDTYLQKYSFMYDDKKELYLFYESSIPDVHFYENKDVEDDNKWYF